MKKAHLLLDHSAAALLVLVLLFFGAQSGKFLEPRNLANIIIQASSTGIVAVGMTFVLLTAGVDLSVGAIMFVAAAVAGKMALNGWPLWAVTPAMLAVGLVFGGINGFFVTRVRVAAFIVTLATLFIGRGIGLRITETRALNLPESILQLGTAQFLGLPVPGWLFGAILILAHVTLTRTPFGRQILAAGHSAESARKAGLNVGRILTAVYLISALCAAVGAMVTLGQLGAVSPKFGEQKEFAAIAAAVLGGTSLFGGRGSVLPGTLLGTLLIQTIQNGLVVINANPYLYPMITSVIIFVAVALESLRNRFSATTSYKSA